MVTRLLAPELNQPRDQVRYSGAITSAKGPKLLIAATAMRLYRFRQLKVKVGIAGYNDVQRLRRIRRCVGRRIDRGGRQRKEAGAANDRNGARSFHHDPISASCTTCPAKT